MLVSISSFCFKSHFPFSSNIPTLGPGFFNREFQQKRLKGIKNLKILCTGQRPEGQRCQEKPEVCQRAPELPL